MILAGNYRRGIACSLAGVLFFATTGSCQLGFADEKGQGVHAGIAPDSHPSTASRESIERLILQLGADRYLERQAAFAEIWKLAQSQKESVVAALKVASESPDLEIATAARWLHTLTRLTASPHEVSALLRSLALVRSGDVYSLIRLAREGRWEHVLSILEILKDHERKQLTDETGRTSEAMAILLRLAWDQQQIEKIPALVDLLWPTTDAVWARRLWHELGLTEMSRIAYRTPPSEAVTTYAEAESFIRWVELAGRSSYRELVQEALDDQQFEVALNFAMEQSLWDMAIEAHAAIEQPTVPRRRPSAAQNESQRYAPVAPSPRSIHSGAEAIRAARYALLYHWNGEPESARLWAEALGEPALKEEDISGLITGLAFTGQLEKAIELARQHAPQQAFEILVVHGRIHEALTAVGIDALDEANIRKWLDKALAAPILNARDDFKHTTHLATVGTVLNRLGETKLGRQVDDAVIQWISGAGSEHLPQSAAERTRSTSEIVNDRWRSATFVWMTQHRRKFALQRLEQLLREGIDEELKETILYQLYRDVPGGIEMPLLASKVLDWFYQQREKQWMLASEATPLQPVPGEVTSLWGQALDDLEGFANGREPKSWPTHWLHEGFHELGQSLIAHADREEQRLTARHLAQVAIELRQYDLGLDWIQIGASATFRRILEQVMHGERRAIQDGVQGNRVYAEDLDRFAVVGDLYFQQRDFARAKFVYAILNDEWPTRIDYLTRYLRCLDVLGESDAANLHRLFGLSIPLTSQQAREEASRLEAEEQWTEAITLLRHSFHSKTNEIEDYFARAALDRIGQSVITQKLADNPSIQSLERKVLENAFRDAQLMWLGRLDTFPGRIFELKHHPACLESLWRSKARLAIADGDFLRADEAFRQGFLVSPEQIESPIELMPSAEAAFGHDRVWPWFELYADRLEEHLTLWPDDTLIGNNLAWLYANLGVRLERARDLAKHVTEILPDDPIYLDTLAEVEFRLGNFKEAVQLAIRCRELAPLEPHNHRQVQKFRQGLVGQAN